jgi:hypothetical protein
MVLFSLSEDDIEQLKAFNTFITSCKHSTGAIQLPRVGIWHIEATPEVLRQVFPFWKPFDSFVEIENVVSVDIVNRMKICLPREENYKDSTSHPNGHYGVSWAQPMTFSKEQFKSGILMRDNYDKGIYIKDIDSAELIKQL